MFQLLSSLIVLQTETNDELPVDMETIMMISIISSIIFLIIGIAVGYWIYKDASKRENNELAWAASTGVFMFLFFPIGIVLLIVYFVIRGEETTPEPVSEQATGEDW